jgi:hypothetical protein
LTSNPRAKVNCINGKRLATGVLALGARSAADAVAYTVAVAVAPHPYSGGGGNSVPGVFPSIRCDTKASSV